MKTKSYIIPLIIFLIIGFFASIYLTFKTNKAPIRGKDVPYRIAIASSPVKHKTSTNSIAVNILEELSKEYGFDFLQIESGENFEWLYAVGEIHEANPIDLLIGVGWEASEFFPIIHSRYENLQYVILDNKVEFPYAKSVFFSRYDCSYLLGAMMATAFPQENVFGFISNFETIYTDTYIEGFKDGLHSINPRACISAVYTKSYHDDTIAYKLAKEQNEFGINVIMSTLSPQANEGVYRYAKESESTDNPVYTTCLGVDETAEINPFILTGITENIELALRLVITEFLYHGHNLNTVHLGLSDNGAEVLFATTQEANYRNKNIMTDSVIAAGKRAFEQIEAKNARMQSAQEVEVSKGNQIIIRGTLLQGK